MWSGSFVDTDLPACGEAAGHHDYSLKHFGEEAPETLAHVDGRVFSTFRPLVTRPGLASNFVVCNVMRPAWKLHLGFSYHPVTPSAPSRRSLADE